MNWKQIDDKLGMNWRGAIGLIAGLCTLLLVLIAGGLINGARAAELPKAGKIAAPATEAELTSTAARWTGLWAADSLGYGFEVSERAAEHGALFGGAAGFDYAFANRMLAGIGADIDWTREGDRSWSLWGRGGFLVSPTTLAYALAGMAQPTGEFNFDNLRLTVGAGLEALLDGGWFVRTEARWVDLDDAADGYTAKLMFGYRFGGAK